MIKVAHIALTLLAGSPIRIVNALNKCKGGDVEARLIVLREHAYGNRTFENDLSWKNDEEISREVIRSSDIVHFHHYFNLDSVLPFGESFLKMSAPDAKFLRQYHSHPMFIAKNNKSLAHQVIYSDIPSVVIAQYPERNYPNSLVVPNIVPTGDKLYFPSEHRTGERIGFSPSTDRSAWDHDEATRWDTKGAPETLSCLRRIKNVFLMRKSIISLILRTKNVFCERTIVEFS